MYTVLLNATQVRQRYGGLSAMGLWRWIYNERLEFPKPLIVNTRRYWWQHELEAWERARVGGTGRKVLVASSALENG